MATSEIMGLKPDAVIIDLTDDSDDNNVGDHPRPVVERAIKQEPIDEQSDTLLASPSSEIPTNETVPEGEEHVIATETNQLPGPNVPVDDGVDLSGIEALQMYVQNRETFTDTTEDAAITPAPAEPVQNGVQENGNTDDVITDWNAELEVDPATASEENEWAIAAFAQRKAEYERKKSCGQATEADDIEFEADKVAEKARLRVFLRSQAIVEDAVQGADPESEPTAQDGQASPYAEENSLFIPESTPVPETPARKRTMPKPKNRINAKELREAMSLGFGNEQPKNQKKRKARKSNGEGRPNKRQQAAEGSQGAKKGRKRPNLSNIQSLGTTNIIQAAQANASRPDMPTFTSQNKSQALKELIASIPLADRGSHNSDKNAIMEASKKFNGRGTVRSDGHGGWKLRGMESSLFHHQLLGAAFLRDRENSDSKPKGGLVCDEMGFGKTIQMIANILDGKPDEQSPVKTTLIIAPPALLNQWMDEMNKHVKGDALGRILRYHSGSRLQSNNILSDLMAYDVILTTYGEVQRSYPVAEPPKHLCTEEKKNEWWRKFYEEHVGPLHRIKFHRIVLDEAHHIKNYTSKTSIAVRALTGNFKWCITGTPILNYIEELFPYFSFLKVPHTGDYATFCHNFCNNRMGREPVDMERIHNILRAIMLRRTHVDTLFNAPIVKLPGIRHSTRPVEFNEVERALYNMVKSRYVHEINAYSKSGELTANYGNLMTMMLRLRMLCSHIFLCQDTLKQMFMAADIENLWRLTAKEVQTPADEIQQNMITSLRKMVRAKDRMIVTSQTRDTDIPATENPVVEAEESSTNTGGTFGLCFKFRKFLRSLSESNTWLELHLRSTCAKCRLPPDDPVCTSCFHVYCKECICAMEFDRREKGGDRVACIECGAHFEETSPCSGLKELGFNSDTVAEKLQKIKSKKNKRTAGPRRGSQVVPDDSDEEEVDRDWIEMGRTVLPSAKLAATKAAILNWRQTHPNEKIIIYTQFLGLCRILARLCKEEGWGQVPFNGKMTLEAREKSIEKFQKDPAIFILICSLKAGGVGLNLTMASKVIILDLWFNSAVEAQAYCRAFRIGQSNMVEVVRFVVKDSIDEDLIKMQERKDVEVTGAIGPDTHGKRATIAQLLALFGEVKEGAQNEFILVEDEDENKEDDWDARVDDRVPPRPF